MLWTQPNCVSTTISVEQRMKYITKTLFVVLLASALTVCKISAQTNEFEQMSLSELMDVEVETATRNKQDLRLAPGSITVVWPQDIEAIGARYLFEVLDQLPQIQVHRRAGTVYHTAITVRGIHSNNRVHVLVNGIKVNNTDGVYARIMYEFPVHDIEYIEVNLTPSSTLFGADAYAGVINIVTNSGSNGLSASAGMGMYGAKTGHISFGTGTSDVSLNGFVDVFHSDQPSLPEYFPDYYEWYHNKYRPDSLMSGFGDDVNVGTNDEFTTPLLGASGSLRLQAGSNELGIYVARSRHSSSVAYAPSTALSVDDAFLENTLLSIYAKNEFTPTDAVTIKSSIEWNKSELSPESNFQNIYSGYSRGYKYEKSDQFQVMINATATLSENSAISLGVAGRSFSAIPYTSDLAAPFETNLSATEQELYYIGSEVYDKDSTFLGIRQNVYAYDKEIFSLLGQYEYTFGKQFNATVGARFDVSSRYSSILNPRIGIAWTPDPMFSVKALGSRSYQDPSSKESYIHFGSFYPVVDTSIVVDSINGPYNQIVGLGSGFFQLTNPDLEREYIDNVSVSVLCLPEDNLAIFGEVYYNDLSNLIIQSYASNEVFEGVEIQSVARGVNAADAHTYGATIEIDYRSKISSELQLDSKVSYDYTGGEYNGEELVGVAGHSVKFTFSSTFDNTVTVTLFGNYMSEALSQSSSASNPIVDGRVILHAFVRWDINETFALSTKIENATNLNYFGPVWQSAGVRAPQDPLTATMWLDIRL